MNAKILTGLCLLAGIVMKAAYAGGSPCKTGTGDVIIDNTETSSVLAISANLGFRCSKKGSTAITSGFGGNAINIDDFQVLVRKPSDPLDDLQLFVGKSSNTVSDFNFGTDNQFDFFALGKHLFDLDRLRLASDWMTTHVTPDPGVSSGDYGTISMSQFLANIAAGKTMYGIVRVLVPLQAGQSSSTRNALGDPVPAGSLYGFCSTSANLCSCAPGTSFSKITAGASICGYNLPADAKIKVKGALFWDFVDSVDAHPLQLAELSFVPRELYFKVEIPIMVNWAHDSNDDGAMDNMDLVRTYTLGYGDGDVVNTTFSFADVPVESKKQYQYETGTALTQALFDALDPATKYHMMLPSGYADGWAEAFDKLNITAADWGAIPGMAKPFRIPKSANGVLTADDVRSPDFEDIPTYLYSGGLIDMHNHVNVSGLVYVPQGMELEAKQSGVTRQYVSGAIIIRDSFYIEAKSGTITVISSDPLSYSGVRRSVPPGGTLDTTFVHGNAAYHGGGTGGGSGGSPSGAGGGSGGSGSNPMGDLNWQEIRPNLP